MLQDQKGILGDLFPALPKFLDNLSSHVPMLLCLTEEDLGMLMSLVCIVILYRRKGNGGGCSGVSWVSGMGFTTLYEELPFQERLFSSKQFMHI
jgi:hypothetical protein